MKILAFDCSAAHGSIAVVENGATLFAETFEIPRGRGSAFFPALDRAVKTTGRADRIAVGIGPGSYNGLRAAIAAAEGLHLAWGVERVGIVSTRAMPIEGDEYFALGDARGGVLWLASIVGRQVAGEFELLPAREVRRRLDEKPGVPRIATAALPDFPGAPVQSPAAKILARLAEAEVPAEDTIEPLYLKPAHITPSKPARSVPGRA